MIDVPCPREVSLLLTGLIRIWDLVAASGVEPPLKSAVLSIAAPRWWGWEVASLLYVYPRRATPKLLGHRYAVRSSVPSP